MKLFFQISLSILTEIGFWLGFLGLLLLLLTLLRMILV